MSDVFCRIINGELPSKKVYEDDSVLAILDISQATRGHVLVMPKAHTTDFFSAPIEDLHKVYDVARLIGEAERVALGADGFNVLTNAGACAGQSVPHFHVHVIPRYKDGDDIEFVTHEHKMSDEDLSSLAANIKFALKI